ncbi:hypothetical protein CRE_14129 [Caenorhabditis remanei]|uniref:Uncharacterized protein n=1 Tax=Caenorhabditis remanei TaxID=31234 RepID=E3MRE4_CAERE|nr:hypothetical protein CRE_14129 [Caenorhabditis remanei]
MINYRKEDYDSMNGILSRIDWTLMLANLPINDMYSLFIGHLKELIYNYVPILDLFAPLSKDSYWKSSRLLSCWNSLPVHVFPVKFFSLWFKNNVKRLNLSKYLTLNISTY